LFPGGGSKCVRVVAAVRLLAAAAFSPPPRGCPRLQSSPPPGFRVRPFAIESKRAAFPPRWQGGYLGNSRPPSDRPLLANEPQGMPATLRPLLAEPFASRPPAAAHRSPSPQRVFPAAQSPRPRIVAAIVSARACLPFYRPARASRNERYSGSCSRALTVSAVPFTSTETSGAGSFCASI
jgi:hypothetical protein